MTEEETAKDAMKDLADGVDLNLKVDDAKSVHCQ